MVKIVQITIENEAGEMVRIADEGQYSEPFFLHSIEGLGDLEAEHQSQKPPYQDGSIPLDTIFRERTISITCRIIARKKEDLPVYRQLLSRVCNPKKGEVKITYEDGFQTKEITGKADNVPVYGSGREERTEYMQLSLLSFTCFDPYWRDPQKVSRALRAYQGRFRLPTKFPFELGISGDTTILYNDGDIETPVTIDIQGPVTNPQIINKTVGQFIRVNRSLSDNEILHIDTSPRGKRIEIYRDGWIIENAIGYLDHNSDFWQLQVGGNEIQYLADAGQTDAIVAIAWHNRYTGI